jgi:cell division protein FtsL
MTNIYIKFSKMKKILISTLLAAIIMVMSSCVTKVYVDENACNKINTCVEKIELAYNFHGSKYKVTTRSMNNNETFLVYTNEEYKLGDIIQVNIKK